MTIKKFPRRLLTGVIIAFAWLITGRANLALSANFKREISALAADHQYGNSLFDGLIKELSNSAHRYFVYDNPTMTVPDIREKAGRGNFTWRHKWGARYKMYAHWELEYLKALEEHPLRTHDANKADFIVIPIPVNAISVAGNPSEDMRHALDTLYNETLFQRHPEKHVLFSFLEYVFDPRWESGAQSISGISPSDYQQLRPITAAMFQDHHSWLLQVPDNVKEVAGWGQMAKGKPLTTRGFSISLMGSAMDFFDRYDSPSPLTLRQFQNKTYPFFYHTRAAPSLNNSTKFRHALVKENETALQLPQPSSVGFDIPLHDWRRAFYDSKFCPCIRGDNPQTRCLWRSIRAGCIPLVISNMWPRYAPIFKSFLNMTNYAVLVDENQFLHNPVATLVQATNMTTVELQAKIEGLNLVRRMILPHLPSSLFVEAFARETVASQKDDYYPYLYASQRDRSILVGE